MLAAKIAAVLPLHGNVTALLSITAFVGGLVSAFAALSGSFLRRAVAPKKVVVARNDYSTTEIA